MEEISIQELFFTIRKRLVLIISLCILFIAVAGVLSYFVLDKEYETFTTLIVGKPKDYQGENNIEYNDIILNQRLVSTYGEIVKMRVVADKVIDNLKLPISYSEFGNKVSVELVQDTEIIKLKVVDEDPVLAADIANETAEVFMDSVKDIMLVENVQVIDKAQVPKNPVSPRPLLNMAIAGVLGIMIGIFIAFLLEFLDDTILLEFLDDTIKTENDVEKKLELPVIGIIPLFGDDE